MNHPLLHRFALLPGLLFATAPLLQAEAIPTPEAYAVDRYEILWTKSPFTLASTEEVITAGFADNLVLGGISTVGDEARVILFDRVSQQRFRVGPEPNERGVRLVEVDLKPNPLGSSATIQMGTDTAVVRFDPAQVRAGPAPIAMPVIAQPPGARAPGQPQVPAAISPGHRAGPASTEENRTPRRRRVVIPSQPR